MVASIASIETRETVKFKWAVFQRRPLSSLPAWKRWLVRRVYKIVNWQTADGEEKQAICDTEAVARAICAAGGPNWFYHRLPVNATLPADTGRQGAQFPTAESSEFYKQLGERQVPVVCPFTHDACRPHDTLRYSQVESIYRKVKTLVTS